MSSHDDIELLLSAGVPLAGERKDLLSLDFAVVSEAVIRVLDSTSEEKPRDAIRGWLIALNDHYPTLFARHFSSPKIIAAIASPRTGRDIKLRRLALSHLRDVA